MGISTEEFGQVQNRAAKGSESAFEILQRLAKSRMLRAIRSRLPQGLRNRVDSQDVVQETWVRFWEKHRNKYFYNANAFGAFLAKVAENIVIDNVRQKTSTAKYNINLEESIHPIDDDHRQREIAARQLTPSQELIRREEWTQYINEQPPVLRRILILYRKGQDPATIAEELHLSRRTVDRYIQSVFNQAQVNSAKK